MALITTKKMFEKAFLGNYAIGAFNINNMEILQSIIEAASQKKSYVILQVSKSALEFAGIKYIKSLVNAASYSPVDIALHLDHGPNFETIKEVIENGFTSVMFDGSHYDFETNISKTKEVVEYAHSKGIPVEAELGVLSGVEDNINVSYSNRSYTDPLQVVEFVERTKVDSLAIAIGTSHGAYKFKGEAKLDFDRLKKITDNLEKAGFHKFPIVLHGASSVNQNIIDMCNKYGANIKNTSGIPEQMLKTASSMSICKINIDTDLRLAFTACIRKFLAENPENFDPRSYLGAARKFLQNIIEYKIENILGSKNSML